MSVAKVIEISATSEKSFDEAVKVGVKKATESLRNVRSAWVKEQRVTINNNSVAEYQVNMQVTFMLDDQPAG